jgi:hypothetical protein
MIVPTPSLVLLTLQRIEGYDRLILRWWWFAAAIAALMIALAAWKSCFLAIAWWRRPRSNPSRLFQQLSRMHKLTKKETSLLLAHAKKLPELPQSAVLFVDPTCWSWKKVEEESRKQSLANLYAKIFGFPPDTSAV